MELETNGSRQSFSHLALFGDGLSQTLVQLGMEVIDLSSEIIQIKTGLRFGVVGRGTKLLIHNLYALAMRSYHRSLVMDILLESSLQLKRDLGPQPPNLGPRRILHRVVLS